MSVLPDLSAHGYAVEALLGTNPEGGRSAYRAVALATQRVVVIKRFAFAREDSSWDGYRAHEREIAMLERLDHPRIPAYIDDFQTADGFCLVQAYCDAPPMSSRPTWTMAEATTLARSALEILVYLQERAPPIIHRDVKPENILVDARGQAHLVDFGLARVDRATTTTLAVGTPGFMAPEQLLGQALSEATDLFGLGAALLCALTGTPSRDVGTLIDSGFRFDLSRLPRSVSPALRHWLSRMVAPSLDERFGSALEALRALDDPASAHAVSLPHTRAGATEARATTSPALPPKARWVIGGVIGAASLVGLGALLTRSSEPASEGSSARPIAPPPPASAPVSRPPPPVSASPGKSRIECHEAMTVTHDITWPDARWAVVAHPGCDLTLRNVTIRARHGISIEGGRVTAEDVVLETSRAIDLHAGEAVFERGRISCSETCVNVRGGSLSLESTSVSSSASAISVDGELLLTDSSVSGDRAVNVVRGGTARLERATVRGAGSALFASQSTVEIIGGRFEGPVRFNSDATVTGLESATYVLGDTAPSFWAHVACQTLVQCGTLTDDGTEVRISLRLEVLADGTLGPPEPDGGGLGDAVEACMAERARAFQMPAHDGQSRRFKCISTGRLDAFGRVSASTHYFVDPTRSP